MIKYIVKYIFENIFSKHIVKTQKEFSQQYEETFSWTKTPPKI